MINPQYKIHGADRKILKKELSQLKSFVKSFWYYHQLDKDMCDIYGCKTENYPMNDMLAQKKLDKTNKIIEKLEKKLSKPFK